MAPTWRRSAIAVILRLSFREDGALLSRKRERLTEPGARSFNSMTADAFAAGDHGADQVFALKHSHPHHAGDMQHD